jgi:hypothetical protein
MNRIVIAAAALMLATGTVYGQAQTDKPAATPAGSPKEITIVQGPGQSTVKEDARHCLEHGTNTDIIKCAEPYLPARKK